MYLEVVALLLLTALNGVLAMSELALVSSRRSRLEQLAAEGKVGAQVALQLKENPTRLLSTVQIGITLVGVVSGAFSGATLGQRFGDWLSEFPALSTIGDPLGISLTVVLVTYISLIFGELVPKRLAMNFPEVLASALSPLMALLARLASPVVWILQTSTQGVLRLLRSHDQQESTITEAEVKAMISEGTQSGVFVPQERAMIEGVLRLADRPVRFIMTPRSQVTWVDVGATTSELIELLESYRYSRLLVCDGTVDQPLGIVHTKDLLPAVLRTTEIDLRSLLSPLLVSPDRAPILSLIDRFREARTHLAVVIDEYGAMDGIVTLTDVIEAIAGDLPEAGEEDAPGVIEREDGSWLVDGRLATDMIQLATGIELGVEIQTIAGLVLHQLGRIPKPGDMLNLPGGSRIEVVDLDGHRIDKVLLYGPPVPDAGE